MRHLPRLLVIGVAALLPRLALAQYTTSPFTPPTAAQCTQAGQTLTAGNLAKSDSQALALSRILECPTQRGAALTAALDRRRGQPYSSLLELAFQTAGSTGEALSKVLQIAADPAASAPARVLSFGTMAGYLTRASGATYTSLQATTLGAGCVLPGGTEARPAAQSLPADYQDRIRATAWAVEQSATAPVALRSAANCVMNESRQLLGLPSQTLSTFDLSQVTLAYECGTRFLARNAQAVPVMLQYDLSGDTARKALSLPPKPAGEPYREWILSAAPLATVRLFFDGNVVRTVTGTGTTCD